VLFFCFLYGRAASNERISAMQSLSRAWTSRAFSSKGLMFSGVMASLGSGSVAGGIERTEPVFPPRRDRENCREGLSAFDVDLVSACS